MEVHKPKPWHGLREFLKEYAIVVIGVLTALAGEQFVENLHWGQRTNEARSQLRAELAGDADSGLAWLALAPCFDRQLLDMEQQLWAARGSGSYAARSARFAPPLFVLTSDAWLNARSLQVSDHFKPEEAKAFSRAYFFPSELAGDIVTLHEEAAELAPLSRPLKGMTPAEADALLAKVGRAKELEARMALGMLLMIKTSDALGAPLSTTVAARAIAYYGQSFGACASDPVQVLKIARESDPKDLAGGAALYRRLNLGPPDLPE